jgi:ABC-2 type transport system ATP-binding protein
MGQVPVGPPAIETRGLSKWYRQGLLGRRRQAALSGLSLTVERGEIFGYLGPNGSGKTTTLKLLLGLLFPDEGEVFILGAPHTDGSARARVGFLPEHPYFYDYLTAAEYVDYAGRLCGVPPAVRRERGRALLGRVGLEAAAEAPLRRFSKGMLQRLGLAQALVNDPEVLVLDEPMSGLDPVGRRLVRDLILELKRQGKTILFSTHILSDAESLCDRVGLLRAGRLISAGRLDAILDIDVTHLELLVTGIAAEVLEGLPDGVSATSLGERWRLEIGGGVPLAPVVARLEKAGGRILGLQPVRHSLEEFFFKELARPEREQQWPLAD